MAQMIERGKIINRERAKQLRDFSGLRFGNITPTDIDAFFEIGNNLFIFIEIKYESSELPRGQKLAFERLIDVVGENKKAIFIICEHEEEIEQDIDLASCRVREYRTKKEWKILENEMTVKELIDKFIKFCKEDS